MSARHRLQGRRDPDISTAEPTVDLPLQPPVVGDHQAVDRIPLPGGGDESGQLGEGVEDPLLVRAAVTRTGHTERTTPPFAERGPRPGHVMTDLSQNLAPDAERIGSKTVTV